MPTHKLKFPKWDEDRIIVTCDCGSAEHQVIIAHSPDEDINEFSIEIHLSHYRGFFSRLLGAIRYVFGYRSRYGDFDNIIVADKDASEIVSFLVEHSDVILGEEAQYA